MNEICKNNTKGYKIFLAILIYIVALMYILNMTVGKLNLLACDILTLTGICAGVYFLYRYKVISYRYVLDEENLTISKIAGKNNEQVQAVIDYKNIISFEEYSGSGAKNALNYCATIKKDNRYVLVVEMDGKQFTVLFQPSTEFAEELSKRKDIINEEI